MLDLNTHIISLSHLKAKFSMLCMYYNDFYKAWASISRMFKIMFKQPWTGLKASYLPVSFIATRSLDLWALGGVGIRLLATFGANSLCSESLGDRRTESEFSLRVDLRDALTGDIKLGDVKSLGIRTRRGRPLILSLYVESWRNIVTTLNSWLIFRGKTFVR